MAAPPQQRRVHDSVSWEQIKPVSGAAEAIGDERVRSADEGVAAAQVTPRNAVVPDENPRAVYAPCA